jgi:hypothetical protein
MDTLQPSTFRLKIKMQIKGYRFFITVHDVDFAKANVERRATQSPYDKKRQRILLENVQYNANQQHL